MGSGIGLNLQPTSVYFVFCMIFLPLISEAKITYRDGDTPTTAIRSQGFYPNRVLTR
jgi:hypothetical protein